MIAIAPRFIQVDTLEAAHRLCEDLPETTGVILYIKALNDFYYPADVGGMMTRLFSQVFLNDPPDPDAAMAIAYRDDTDLICLEVRGNERRLNRLDCVGRPLNDLDAAVADPRRRAIEQAIATGHPTTYYYSHYWRGLEWHFRGVARHHPAQREVAVLLYDLEDWQATWWHSQV